MAQHLSDESLSIPCLPAEAVRGFSASRQDLVGVTSVVKKSYSGVGGNTGSFESRVAAAAMGDYSAKSFASKLPNVVVFALPAGEGGEGRKELQKSHL